RLRFAQPRFRSLRLFIAVRCRIYVASQHLLPTEFVAMKGKTVSSFYSNLTALSVAAVVTLGLTTALAQPRGVTEVAPRVASMDYAPITVVAPVMVELASR